MDHFTQISFKPIPGKICEIFSQQTDDQVQNIDLDHLELNPQKDWLNYLKGMLIALKQQWKTPKSAFQACITSSLPLASGMSSSAALEMAFITGLDHLNQWKLTLHEKARLGQICENQTIGANTGLMDQLSVLNGQDKHLLLSEYRHHDLQQITFPDDLCFLVVNTHVQHDLSFEYNDRREQCEQAAIKLKKDHPEIQSLRDVDLQSLTQSRPSLEHLEYLRAKHVISENHRVLKTKELLENHLHVEFGELLFQSHQSSIDNFENSCPQLDFLINYAKHSNTCLGARLSGGGFGGISLHLLKREHASDYSKEIKQAFYERFNLKPQTLLTQPSKGAFVIDLK